MTIKRNQYSWKFIAKRVAAGAAVSAIGIGTYVATQKFLER